MAVYTGVYALYTYTALYRSIYSGTLVHSRYMATWYTGHCTAILYYTSIGHMYQGYMWCTTCMQDTTIHTTHWCRVYMVIQLLHGRHVTSYVYCTSTWHHIQLWPYGVYTTWCTAVYTAVYCAIVYMVICIGHMGCSIHMHYHAAQWCEVPYVRTCTTPLPARVSHTTLYHAVYDTCWLCTRWCIPVAAVLPYIHSAPVYSAVLQYCTTPVYGCCTIGHMAYIHWCMLECVYTHRWCALHVVHNTPCVLHHLLVHLSTPYPLPYTTTWNTPF